MNKKEASVTLYKLTDTNLPRSKRVKGPPESRRADDSIDAVHRLHQLVDALRNVSPDLQSLKESKAQIHNTTPPI